MPQGTRLTPITRLTANNQKPPPRLRADLFERLRHQNVRSVDESNIAPKRRRAIGWHRSFRGKALQIFFGETLDQEDVFQVNRGFDVESNCFVHLFSPFS
jgi:hypothetical protein